MSPLPKNRSLRVILILILAFWAVVLLGPLLAFAKLVFFLLIVFVAAVLLYRLGRSRDGRSLAPSWPPPAAPAAERPAPAPEAGVLSALGHGAWRVFAGTVRLGGRTTAHLLGSRLPEVVFEAGCGALVGLLVAVSAASWGAVLPGVAVGGLLGVLAGLARPEPPPSHIEDEGSRSRIVNSGR
jgi:hypothetical protein